LNILICLINIDDFIIILNLLRRTFFTFKSFFILFIEKFHWTWGRFPVRSLFKARGILFTGREILEIMFLQNLWFEMIKITVGF